MLATLLGTQMLNIDKRSNSEDKKRGLLPKPWRGLEQRGDQDAFPLSPEPKPLQGS